MKLIKPAFLVPGLALALTCFQVTAEARQRQARAPAVSLKVNVKSGRVTARLEEEIPRLMNVADVPGLSAALIRDGKVAWLRGFGVMNAATRAPVRSDTVFEAASLSKPVVAYAVLKLVDAGKLSLDVPLVKYLPGAYVENDERLSLITARRVLSHTAGLPNWRPQGQPLKIYLTPGERFSYSGEGFVYLQKVVEHLTGETLDELVRKNVFEPLGMKSSSFVWQGRYETLKAAGHNAAGVPREMRKPTEANAAGGLHTTALDYAKFVIAAMNGTGLKKETAGEMLTAQVRLDETCHNCIENRAPPRLSKSLAWGLGWGLQNTSDGPSFWHWGDNNGEFHCYAVAYPARKLGLVVFTNSGNGHSIIPDIIALAVGGQHPAIPWMDYELYNSPAKQLYRDILARGGAALDEYKGRRKSGPSPLNESQINRLGYWLLAKKRIKEAVEVFKINVEDYPSSWNVYDSLGEAYMLSGDRELAIRNYEKSIELNPNNTDGIRMLKRLRGQQ